MNKLVSPVIALAMDRAMVLLSTSSADLVVTL